MKHAFADTTLGQVYYESEGEGEPLVCLHQISWSSGEYVKLIPYLSKSFQVIAPDLLGYGLSDPAPQKWTSVQDWTASVVQFLDVLGIRKANLIGSHAGAKLALELAASQPGRVRKMVLYGCAIYDTNSGRKYDPNGPWSKEVQTTTLAERIALARELQQAKPDIPVSGLHFYETWNTLVRQDPAADAETIQNAFLANVRTYDKRCAFSSGTMSDLVYELETRAPLAKRPSLLVAGDKATTRSPIYKAPESLAKLIPRCRVIHVEGAGNLGLSTNAAELGEKILAFLNKS